MRRRGLMAWIGLGLLACGVGAAWASTRDDHGDPDPGGRVLASLVAAERVVPAKADVLLRQAYEPHWDSCDGRAGTFGWSDVTMTVQFRTPSSPQALLSEADGSLQASGWQRTDTLHTDLGPGAVWTRHVAGPTTARLTLAPGTSGDGIYWNLSAVAPSRGLHASGC